MTPNEVAKAIINKYHGTRITMAGLETIMTSELEKYYSKIRRQAKIDAYREIKRIATQMEAME